MPEQQTDSLDLASLMKDQHGMTFAGMSDNNLPIYKKESGEEQEIDAGKLAQGMGLDPTKTKINYNTSDTPINQVPDVVSIGTRFALAAGNTKGGIEYLKRLGLEDVKYNPDLGFVGKEQGVWKAIDPQGLGEGSAWDKTKEAMRDVADQAFTAANVGAQVGMAAMTEGASLVPEMIGSGVSGAATESVRLSFGRALGTYDATPEEVHKDLGLEFLFNAGGAAFAAGVRPGVQAMSSAVRKTFSAFNNAPQAAKDIMASTVGALGHGEKNVAKVFEEGPAIAATLDEMGSKYGRFNAKGIQEGITNDQIGLVKEAANEGQGAMSSLYSKMRNDVINSVPKNFSASSDDLVQPLQNTLAELNIGKWVDDSGKLISQDEVAYRSEAGKTFENGVNFKLLDQKELLARAHELAPEGELGALKNQVPGFLATSKEGQALVGELHSALETISGSGEGSGKAAAARLLNQAKTVKDILHTMSEQAREGALGPIQAAVGKMQQTVGDSISSKLASASPEAAENYAKLMETYSNAKTAFAPFQIAANRAAKTGSDIPYQTLLNQVSSKSDKATGTAQKNALEKLSDVLAQNSEGAPEIKGLAYKFAEYKNQLEIKEAAKAFAPLTKGGVSVGALGGGGAAIGGGVAGPLGAAIGAATGILGQSPRAAFNATRVADKMLPKGAILEAGTGAHDALTNTMFAAKKLLEKMPKGMRDNLIQNPNALRALINSVAIVPTIHNMTQQSLAQKMQQGQGPQQ